MLQWHGLMQSWRKHVLDGVYAVWLARKGAAVCLCEEPQSFSLGVLRSSQTVPHMICFKVFKPLRKNSLCVWGKAGVEEEIFLQD
jgi:hypothetical protein